MRSLCHSSRSMLGTSLIVVLSACAEALLVTEEPVASVSVTPAAASIIVGSVLPVAGMPLDAAGYPLVDRAMIWTTSDPDVATVVPTSVVTASVTALTPGSATVTASSEGYSNTVQVTVTSQSIDTIVVVPPSGSVSIGQTLQLSATPKDAGGTALTGRTIAWSSSNTSLATVSAAGVVTGVGAGLVGITASSEGKLTTATVTVLTPATTPVASVSISPSTAGVVAGQTVQLSATPRDAGGAPLAGRTVTWASSNTGIATVSSTGLVTGVAPGSTVMTATSENQSGVAAVSVTAAGTTGNPGQISNLTVVGVTQTSATLSFTEVDGGNGAAASYDIRFALAPFSWGSAASVSQGTCAVPAPGTTIGAARTCTVTGLTAGRSYQFQMVAFRGTLNVDAVFGALSNVASGTTSASTAPVASVTVSPTSVTLGVGASQQFAVTLRDANGTTLSGRTTTWSISNSAIATVSLAGLVTGITAGPATITATSEGQTGTATLTVSVLAPSQWPNEPSGFTPIRDAPWNAVPPISGWSAAYNEDRLATVVADATAPFSPSSVLQFRYPAGFAGGSAPATIYADGITAKEYFVGLWWKPSDPWQGHPSSINKIMFFYTASRADAVVTMYGPNGGPYHVRVVTQGMPSSGSYLTQNVNVVPVVLGQWTRIELHMKYDSSFGARDGFIRWWINGVLVGNHAGLGFPNDAGFHEFQLSPTWGGLNATKSRDDFFWYDHVYLSRK